MKKKKTTILTITKLIIKYATKNDIGVSTVKTTLILYFLGSHQGNAKGDSAVVEVLPSQMAMAY